MFFCWSCYLITWKGGLKLISCVSSVGCVHMQRPGLITLFENKRSIYVIQCTVTLMELLEMWHAFCWRCCAGYWSHESQGFQTNQAGLTQHVSISWLEMINQYARWKHSQMVNLSRNYLSMYTHKKKKCVGKQYTTEDENNRKEESCMTRALSLGFMLVSATYK